MKKHVVISVFVVAVIILAAALGLYALRDQPPMVENTATDWQTSHNDDFNLTVAHPPDCTLSFMPENPLDEEKTVFTLDCGSTRLISVGYVYHNLVTSYLTERRQNNSVVREMDALGHTLLQLSLSDASPHTPSLVTYITDKGSDLTLEIYGPEINESENIALYNRIVDSITFN